MFFLKAKQSTGLQGEQAVASYTTKSTCIVYFRLRMNFCSQSIVQNLSNSLYTTAERLLKQNTVIIWLNNSLILIPLVVLTR